MKIVLLLVIVASLVISPNLLYMAGIGYGVSGGGALEKIHPCAFLALVGFFLQMTMGGKNKIGYIKDRELYRLIGVTFLLSAYCFAMGYVVSIPIVTFMTPLLVYSMMQHADRLFLYRIGILVRVLIAINALLGIYEAVSGLTLLERTVGDTIIEQDTRSIGFLGHPLSSSLASSLVAIYLIRDTLSSRLSLPRALEIALLLFAIVAFGGRVALVATAILSIWAVLFGNKSTVSGKKIQPSQVTLRIAMLVTLISIGVFLVTSDFGGNTIARFGGDENAEKSTESRYSAILILLSMSPQELLLGVSDVRRVSLMGAFDTDLGVEITWISWVLSFGAVWAVVLGYLLFRVIYLSTKGRPASLKYMSVLFVVAITGAQGLGGKTLLLTWFLTMLVCFDQVPANSSTVRTRIPQMKKFGALKS